jgi:glycine oxidase
MRDVIVIGGGVIGLSIARELSQTHSVLVLDKGEIGEGTSWAAAGILSPQSEVDSASTFFELGMASRRLYPELTAALREETGTDPLYCDEGLLVLGFSEEDMNVLRARCVWQRRIGLESEMISGPQVRELEPLVTLPVEGAMLIPTDSHVVPRLLVKALHQSCLCRNVTTRAGVLVNTVAKQRVHAGSEVFEAKHIVVASGVWSAQIDGLSPRVPVQPRKGEILSLRMPERAFRRIVRWEHTYFVPRRNGELVVGATNTDAGFDRVSTRVGIGSLLTSARKISSHIESYPILETWSGLRPATPDGMPIIGFSSLDGVIYATGHYRNGVLLAPITAAIVAALINGKLPPVPIEAFSPFRFQC